MNSRSVAKTEVSPFERECVIHAMDASCVVDLELDPRSDAGETSSGELQLALGTRLGKFQVMGVLGHGWEASVYQVRQRGSRRLQSLKCYRRRPGVRRAVSRRIGMLRSIDGSGGMPRVAAECRIVFEGRSWPAILCDFRHGVSLEDFVEASRRARLPSEQVLAIGQALARALVALHGRGAYHGDLHEGNIILARCGRGFRVHLVDPFPQSGAVERLQRADLVECVRILVRCFGSGVPYSRLPAWMREIARGLQAQRILASTPTVIELLGRLRREARRVEKAEKARL